MKKFILLSLICSLSFSLKTFAQNLPHWLTDEERSQLPSYLLRDNTIRSTDPPDFVPRASAEWEEIQGLLITWTSYTSILKQIVAAIQDECTVYIVCSDSNTVINALTSDGIPTTNVKFLEEQFNSVWCRDYGPWNIYKNDVEEVSLVDWIYNRPRPKDDVIPGALASYIGLPIYETTEAPNDLVNTGGNFMVDGNGTAFSSKLILLDNGPNNEWNVTEKTTEDIDTILNKYMGINRYVLMDTLPYDEIHHIDMHMKLLDEETLLVGEFPTGVADGPQIEENIQYIQDNFPDCYGRPYKIVRIPMPPSTSGQYVPNTYYRTYTNSVIVNKSVIVPTYREQYDTTAIRIYKENMPGYKIHTIDCDDGSFPIISALGAIHCITKEVAVNDPIWISHAPLQNTFDAVDPYLVEAKIKTPSGVSDATMFWSIDTLNGYNSEVMTVSANDSFYAYIPAQPIGTQIFYYINAVSNSGRIVNRPLTAPDGWWKFEVEGATGLSYPESPSTILFDPYPNPTINSVNIGLSIPASCLCRMIIRDAIGRSVAVLVDGTLNSGIHKFSYHPATGPGLYYVEVVAGNKMFSKKFVVAGE